MLLYDPFQPSIKEFQGEYRFLSNYWACLAGIYLDGLKYPTVEHAYQAAKTLDESQREGIRIYCATPSMAKREGRDLDLRENWDGIKQDIMLDLVRQKFTRDPILKQSLLQTHPRELIEGNTWGDTYWGVCRGKGENHLGKILMQVRREIKEAGE